MRDRALPILAAALCWMLSPTHSTAFAFPAAPAGDVEFEFENWPGDWGELVGITPVGDGRFVAWERSGVGWMVGPDGLASTEPLFDITEEVNPYRDHGLLGLALDPDFLSNGHLYLLYVVDRHHLLNFGTPGYDAETDDHVAATIGRITRYTATRKSDRSVIDPSSRLVLLGESILTGLPIINTSHGLGSLAFGDDGTLLCSMGDTGGYTMDVGGNVPGGWVEQGLEDGIITEAENVGSLRAQMIDSLAGKILRIDPTTGDGVPSNPWFDASSPRSPRSRVWAMGLRNAFRMSVTPGTGSDDPAAGDPGEIVYGDVGAGFREEVGIVDGPGRNLGWPLYEGLDSSFGYWPTDILHPTAVNPLADADCPERLRFRDLLFEEGEIRCNPCDPAWTEASAWQGAGVSRNSAGWTGDGHVDFGGSTGDWIEFTIDVPDRKLRTYAIRYANGAGVARPIELQVDGIAQSSLELAATGGWNAWRRLPFELSLAPGSHTIRIVAEAASNAYIDRLDTPDLPYTPLDVEAVTDHHRATIDWRHNNPEARVPLLAPTGEAIVSVLGEPDCPVEGASFAGNCATGGIRLDDARWPEDYRGVYFGDFIYGWIRVLRMDENGDPVAVETLSTATGKVSSLVFDPVSGSMLAVRFSLNPVRITPPASPEPGDLNGDGIVDGGDLGLLLAGWGTSGPGDLDGDGTVNGSDLGLLLAEFSPPTTPCPGDLDGNRTVDSADLGLLLALWDQTGPGDLNGDGRTDSSDIGLLLAVWGPCPE